MSVLTPKRPVYHRELARGAYYPISVEQYHEMIAKSVLTEDDPVELLEGLLVRKMTKNPPHEAVCYLVRVALEKIISKDSHVKAGGPVTTADSEPEPDLSVIRGSARKFMQRHPAAEDVLLVVEVSDSSLGRDRGIKKRVYANAQTPVYWLINIKAAAIEVYSDPNGSASKPDYRSKVVYQKKDSLPVVLDGREVGRIPVKEILP